MEEQNEKVNYLAQELVNQSVNFLESQDQNIFPEMIIKMRNILYTNGFSTDQIRLFLDV